MSDKPWYHKGLRFQCTRCGNCCSSNGEYQHLYLARHDVEALAAHLSLSEAEFRAAHCDQHEGWTVLRTPGPQCPFLGPDKRCQVYEARPMQCRTWPFWEENLKRERWEGAVRAICPGLDQGRLYPAEEVARIARENEDWYESDGDLA